MLARRFSTILACSVLSLFSHAALAEPSVKFETTQGSFTIELNSEQAPVTVKNFLQYVEDGSYVGSIFHRVIPGFMVQGGGFNTQMERLKTYPPITNESNNGLLNQAGTIAMARTQDPNSATRQFFINLVDNHFLNDGERPPGYAVFGRISSGFDVIQNIGKQKTETQGYMQDVPVQPIIITRVSVLPEKNVQDKPSKTASPKPASTP